MTVRPEAQGKGYGSALLERCIHISKGTHLMSRFIIAFLILLCGACSSLAQTANTTSLNGRVVDARTGEPVSKVKIIVNDSAQSATTNERGNFSVSNLPSGEVELTLTTVGYGLVKQTVTLDAGVANMVEIALSQEAATLLEQVTVTAAPFDRLDTNAASEQTLDKKELAQLSSVIVGDPLRAVQSLPSAVANDDFRSELSLRGAGFDRTGVYLDGVLTDNFIYTV
jgi:hypothetical protein